MKSAAVWKNRHGQRMCELKTGSKYLTGKLKENIFFEEITAVDREEYTYIADLKEMYLVRRLLQWTERNIHILQI